MKCTKLFLFVLAVVITLWPRHSYASWLLNTPEQQTNPLWSGTDLVWNDDRLGNTDIFIRHQNGQVEPLLTAPGDQTLLAADENAILYKQTSQNIQQLYRLDVKSQVVSLIGSDVTITSAAMKVNEIAWSNGHAIFWKHPNGQIETRNSTSRPLLTSLGLVWLEQNVVYLWSSSGVTDIPCLGCTEVAEQDQHLAMLGDSGITFWPDSGTKIDADADSMASDGHRLLYQNGDVSVIYQDNTETELETAYPINAVLGQAGVAYEANNDVNVFDLSMPTTTPDPPKIVGTPSIISSLDGITIKFKTNEKTLSLATITSDESDKPITRRSSRLTISHTISAQGLYPDTEYDFSIVLQDAQHTVFTLHLSIVTLSLADSSVTSGKNGIQEGTVLAEPGVIDDTTMIVQLDRPWLVHWTVGRPPPLHRGSLVRLQGTVNKAGDTILMHGSKSIVEMDIGSSPDILDVDNQTDFEQYAYKWVNVQGTLTHVTKTGWQLQNDWGTVKVSWNNEPTGFVKGQIVKITGFLYFDKGKLIIAATDALLLSDPAVTPKKSHTAAKVSKADASRKLVADAANKLNLETALSTLTEQTYDKTSIIWYNIGLIIIGVFINSRFFFVSRQKS